MRYSGLAITLCLVACGPIVAADEDVDESGTTTQGDTEGVPVPGSSGTPQPSTSSGSVPPMTTSPGTSGPDSSDDGTTNECSFLGCSFDFGPPVECSIFDQDCPDAEKCMPWANDGGNSWNATKCSPIADDPDAPGEPCVVFGSGVSGLDSCDGTSMCWNTDPDTLEGTCYAFCTGDPSNPVCAGECELCSISGDGVLTICLPVCDPVEQDCPQGDGCYPVQDSFTCVPDASNGDGGPGEPCEFTNGCQAGTLCGPSDLVPDCDGTGCCSPFCTVGDDTPCASIPGTECVPYFQDGGTACTPGTIGVCGLP